MENSIINSDIRFLKGVGEKRALCFHRLGIMTIKDLLEYYPRTYEDRSVTKKIAKCLDNETVCIHATVSSSMRKNMVRKNLTIYTVKVSDGTGYMDVVWFNMHFLDEQIKMGDEFVFFGKVQLSPKRQMQSPIFEKMGKNEQTGKIVPIYTLTNGLTQKIIQSTVQNALATVSTLKDPLPEYLRREYQLCEFNYAISNIHFPVSQDDCETARKRLVFEELFILQTALLALKGRRHDLVTSPIKNTGVLSEFVTSLPFALTHAQQRVIQEICTDLASTKPMNRLVQGDVGSGKTIVAAAAMFAAVKNGFQSAMMAPTEILAAQHYENLSNLFRSYGINTILLVGSMTAKAKKEALSSILNGDSHIIIGTHALISQNVEYKNLGLVVTDEQHRFGVSQRKSLSDKGGNPHALVMTATPIPRTLALILYGDLDISTIDELPPGRKKIETFVVDESMRDRIYTFIKKEIANQRQIYIVCPLVEESEQLSLKSVTEYTQHLKEDIFADYQVAFIHGKMKTKEKDHIMSLFSGGKIDILVATSVIEVGVNVPNASVMVIENAERFGLSQLHQLRGRVGRGSDKSYCILFNHSEQDYTKERMKIMKETNDGFKIAETDLKLRGPGEFFGTRQHGLPALKIANLYCDMPVLQLTAKCAKNILRKDSTLKLPEHEDILHKITTLFDSNITFS